MKISARKHSTIPCKLFEFWYLINRPFLIRSNSNRLRNGKISTIKWNLDHPNYVSVWKRWVTWSPNWRHFDVDGILRGILDVSLQCAFNSEKVPSANGTYEFSVRVFLFSKKKLLIVFNITLLILHYCKLSLRLRCIH